MIKLILLGVIILIPFVLAYFIFTYLKSTPASTTLPIPIKTQTVKSTSLPTYGVTNFPNTTPLIQKPIKSVIVNLYPPKQSSPSGSTRISEILGKVLIELKLKNQATSSGQIGFIYQGKCTDNGKIVYPLASVKNNESKTLWPTTFDGISKNLPLSMKIYKSSRDLKSYTSCADINKL